MNLDEKARRVRRLETALLEHFGTSNATVYTAREAGRVAAMVVRNYEAAKPAPAMTVDPARLLKEALFACLAANHESAGYSGVACPEGRTASVRFAVHERNEVLRVTKLTAPADPTTRDEAIERMRSDGDADPVGTAHLNWPGLFPEPDICEDEGCPHPTPAIEPRPEAVAVKALEWEPGDGITRDRESWVAKTQFGDVYFVIEGQWWVGMSDARACSGDDEAKADAQADYEARIRSALATPAPAPAASGGLEAVREALVELRSAASDESYKEIYRLGLLHAIDRMDMALETAALAATASAKVDPEGLLASDAWDDRNRELAAQAAIDEQQEETDRG